MKLKAKYIKYICIDYSDLERYLKYIWKKEKSVEILESPNDASYSFEKIKKDEKYFEDKDYQKIINNGYFEWWRLRTVLMGLCKDGKIIEGNYLINVSW